MRILHIITRLIQGGAQRVALELAAAQGRGGDEVHIAFGPVYGPEGSLIAQAEASGVSLHEVSSLRRALLPHRDLLAYWQLRKLIRQIKPDVVHTHSSKAGILGRAAAWAEDVPAIVHTVHGLPFHEHQPQWVNRLYMGAERWAAKRCHALVGVTQAMVDAFVRAGIDQPKMSVIHSGVDPRQWLLSGTERQRLSRAMRESWGIPQEAKVVGVVARLDRLKGQADAIAAFQQIARDLPDAHLVLVGDGWLRKELEAKVAGLASEIRSRIHLPGLLPMQQMAAAYAALDVKVLPSYQEGQSLTLAEALLTGTAIVAYDIGGMPELCLDGKTGRLVPGHDVEGLAKAIRELLLDEAKRAEFAARGRQQVLDHFTVEKMVAGYERVYHHLLSPISLGDNPLATGKE